MKGKLLALTSKKLRQLEKYYQQLSLDNSIIKHPEYKYIYAQILLRNDKPLLAIKAFQDLYKNHPNNSYILTGLSKALLSSNNKDNIKQGLLLLESTLRERPLNKVLSAYYAQALIEVGKINKSIALITKYNRLSSKQAIFYKLLSRAYGKQNNLLKAHTALAEYYYLQGQYKQALTQISLAKKQVKKQSKNNFYNLAQLDSKLLEIKQEQEKYKLKP